MMNSEIINALMFFIPTEDLKLCSGPLRLVLPQVTAMHSHRQAAQHPPKMSRELWWLEMTT